MELIRTSNAQIIMLQVAGLLLVRECGMLDVGVKKKG